MERKRITEIENDRERERKKRERERRTDPLTGLNTVVGDSQGERSNDRILVLSHPDLLAEIGRVDRMGIDATFKSSPYNHYQLLILNGLLGGNSQNPLWVPFFYCLMPNKERGSYTRTFSLIDEAVAAAGSHWRDNLTVMMDFEVAMRQEWDIAHPTHTLKGCTFHFSQVYRYMGIHI